MSSKLYVHGKLELLARRLEHGQRSFYLSTASNPPAFARELRIACAY